MKLLLIDHSPLPVAEVTPRAERVLRVASELAAGERVALGTDHLARALLAEADGPHGAILRTRRDPVAGSVHVQAVAGPDDHGQHAEHDHQDDRGAE